MSLAPRRRPFSGLRQAALATVRPATLAIAVALAGGALVVFLARSGGEGAPADAASHAPRWISVTIRAQDWPPGEAPTFRRLLSYYSLESVLLPATLAANMNGDRCPDPDAPIPVGATVRLALSQAGGAVCAAASPAAAHD